MNDFNCYDCFWKSVDINSNEQLSFVLYNKSNINTATATDTDTAMCHYGIKMTADTQPAQTPCRFFSFSLLVLGRPGWSIAFFSIFQRLFRSLLLFFICLVCFPFSVDIPSARDSSGSLLITLFVKRCGANQPTSTIIGQIFSSCPRRRGMWGPHIVRRHLPNYPYNSHGVQLHILHFANYCASY